MVERRDTLGVLTTGEIPVCVVVHTILVYTMCMKNVTFTADETLIEAARRKAQASRRTLNDEFRAWLEEYVARDEQAARALALIDHVSQYASSGGRRFSREEMNAR